MAEFKGLYDVKIDIDDDEIKDYIAGGYYPADIFPADEPEAWALENGFIREEDKDD